MIRTCALCTEPAKYRGVGGTPLCSKHSKGQIVEPIPVTMADLVELRERVVTFARDLVEEPFDSSDYDHVNNAIDHCRRDIGERLLRALGVKP